MSQPNATQLIGLYQQHLGRTPDLDGFNFWLDTGLSGDELSSAFVEGIQSAPSQATTTSGASSNPSSGVTSSSSPTTWSAPSTRDQVADLYQQTLGRAPDASGLDFWTNTGLSGSDLSDAFTGSQAYADEYNELFSDLDFAGDTLSGQLDNFNFSSMPQGSDASYFDSLGSDFTGLLDRASSIQPPSGNPGLISGQNILNEHSDLTDQIASLKDTFNTEQSRISAFESDISSRTSDIMSDIGSLSIGDADGMNALSRRLDALAREANRFDSMVPFDLNDEISSFDDAASALSDLFSQRQAEQSRVGSAVDAFRDRGSALRSQLRSGDFGDLGALDGVADMVASLESDIRSFSTPLDFDTGQLDSTILSELDSLLSSARSSRDNSLSQLELRHEDLLSELERLSDYDHSGLSSLSRSASQLMSSATPFTGGPRSQALNEAISGLRDRSNERLDSLNARRAELPQEAEQRLADLRATSFYDLDQIESARDSLDPFIDTMSNYGLSNDRSLSRATSFLDQEQARIERDMENAEARRQAARSGLNAFSSFGSIWDQFGGSNNDYLSLLSALHSSGGRRMDDGFRGYVPFSASRMIRI